MSEKLSGVNNGNRRYVLCICIYIFALILKNIALQLQLIRASAAGSSAIPHKVTSDIFHCYVIRVLLLPLPASSITWQWRPCQREYHNTMLVVKCHLYIVRIHYSLRNDTEG